MFDWRKAATEANRRSKDASRSHTDRSYYSGFAMGLAKCGMFERSVSLAHEAMADFCWKACEAGQRTKPGEDPACLDCKILPLVEAHRAAGGKARADAAMDIMARKALDNLSKPVVVRFSPARTRAMKPAD